MEQRIDKAKIEQEAKQLLDKFAKALEKVEKENTQDFYVERDSDVRTEQEGKQYPTIFKSKILKNAPKSDDDFIIAEKGSWK